MKHVLALLAWLSLLATAAAPVLYFHDRLSETNMRSALLVSAFLWFAVAIVRDRRQVE